MDHLPDSRDALLLTLSDLLQEREPEDALQKVCQLIGHYFQCSRAGFRNLDQDNGTFDFRVCWTDGTVPPLLGRHPTHSFGPKVVVKLGRGETVVVGDLLADPLSDDATTHQTAHKLDTRAILVVPFLWGGHLRSMVYLNHRTPRFWTPAEISLLEEVAARTRRIIELWEATRERIEAIERLEFLDRLNREVANLSDADAILKVITRRAGEHLGVSAVAYSDMDADGDSFTIRGDWSADGAPSIAGRYSLADFGELAATTLRAGRPLIINNNIEEIGPNEAQSFQNMGIAATLCMPLVKEGRFRAAMAFHHKFAHVWTENELTLIREVTERSWAHIERVAAEAQLIEHEELLRLATNAAQIGTWDFNLTNGQLNWDARCKAVFGLPPDAKVTYKDSFLARLHPDDLPSTVAAVDAAIALDGSGVYDVEYRTVGHADGEIRWVAATGRVIALDGKDRRLIGTVQDITARKQAAMALAEETRSLELLNDTAAKVGAELDLGRLVQTVVDAGVAFSAAQFGAFFYNLVDATGESYMLYALSGVDPSNFSKFPMPRNTAVFGPTFAGEGIVRSGDITKDPRYGKNAPRKGMPEGHLPVRSYLAVPVISRSGEVLGGLFFGHEKPEMFGHKSERLMTGLAAQAAIAIDNVRLLQAHQRHSQTLEERVAERTQALLRAEQALNQSQKMEAIGRLTGGIAHDFNNLLMAVTGSLELLRKRVSNEPTITRLLNNAMEGAQRGVSLTQRMLAFARRQELKSEDINVRALVDGMTDLLARSLGPTIIVTTHLPADLPSVHTDPHQLESALLNLCLNARDAMSGQGELRISATAANVAVANAGLHEGDYICLAIADNGEGMDAETLSRATEPFFTTKGIGKGTGLGLAMVQGFAEQSGGRLLLRSQKGRGTTAEIWLPVATTTGGTAASKAAPPISPASERHLHILAIDDDALVLMNTADMLEDLGHRVTAVPSAREALVLLESGKSFDLIITDHAMPQMTGTQFAQQARARWPDLKILMVTGYAELPQGTDIGLRRLAKPFSQQELAAAVLHFTT